jgi:Tfp pilus assembly protein PilF
VPMKIRMGAILPQQDRRPRRFLRDPGLWLSLLLVAMSLALVAPACGFEFVNYDDPLYVADNANVKPGLTLRGLSWACRSLTAFWHPITWLSLQMDASLLGTAAAGFHATNVILHLINCTLLFWILRRWTGNLGRSAAVAFLFALHPLHVETVAWVSERKGLLCTFFGLLAIAAYGWYAQRPGLKRYLPVLGAVVLGLMAKPMLVTLPLGLLLLDFWPAKRSQKIRWLVVEKIPLLLPALATCWLTVLAEQNIGAVQLEAQASWLARVGNAVVAYVQYLQMTFWPSGLTVFYPGPQTPRPLLLVLAAAALLSLILGLTLFQARRHPYLLVGWLWFLGTLVPVIGIVQVGSHLIADRYTYWPHIGLLVMVVWGVADLLAHWRVDCALVPLTVLLACACWLASRQQLSYWHDSRSLWTHAIQVTSNNWIAHNDLGAVLLDQGLRTQAAHEFEQALEIRQDYWEARINLGLVAMRSGDLAQAKDHYAEAIRWGANRDFIFATMGDLYWLHGEVRKAEESFVKALALNPRIAEVEAKLGLALLAQGQSAPAEIHFRRALNSMADDPQLHANLGAALYNQDRVAEAVEQLACAVALDPGYTAGHVKLGMALQRQGRLEEALAQEAEALRLDPDRADALEQYTLVLADLTSAH